MGTQTAGELLQHEGGRIGSGAGRAAGGWLATHPDAVLALVTIAVLIVVPSVLGWFKRRRRRAPMP
jgi:hypothetical protein